MPSHGRVNGSEIFPVAEPIATIQEFDAQRLRSEVPAMFFGRFESAQDLMMREDDASKREGDRDG